MLRFSTHAASSALLAAIMGGAPLLALADGTVHYEADAGQMGRMSMTDRWQGDALRVDIEGMDAFMLLKDDSVYSITAAGGQVMVIPISDLAGMPGAAGANASAPKAGPAFPTEIDGMEPTGETRSIAGIEGEVYAIQWVDNQGTAHTSTAVLTDDPRLLEHQAVKMRFSQAVAGEEPNPLMVELDRRNLAPLTFGDRFTVVEVRSDAGPDGDFVLPAKPMDLKGMMQGFGAP
jgi:hypothetical protein